MTPAIKTAVIGCGYFGQWHGKAHLVVDGANLVAVHDTDRVKAQALASQLGVAMEADLPQLLSKVDAVSIAVPIPNLASVVEECLKRNVHVLAEKPLAQTAEAARALHALAAERNLLLWVGYVERFHPALRLGHQQMPRPWSIRCVRQTPFPRHPPSADAVLDLMCHDIDHTLRFAGALPTRITAAGWSSGPYGALDKVQATLTFPNGTKADLLVDRTASQPKRGMTLAAKGKSLSIDLLGCTIRLSEDTISVDLGNPLAAQISSFLQAVQATTAPLSTDGISVLEIAQEIIARAKTTPLTQTSPELSLP
jgi:predicted dehydrogenase